MRQRVHEIESANEGVNSTRSLQTTAIASRRRRDGAAFPLESSFGSRRSHGNLRRWAFAESSGNFSWENGLG